MLCWYHLSSYIYLVQLFLIISHIWIEPGSILHPKVLLVCDMFIPSDTTIQTVFMHILKSGPYRSYRLIILSKSLVWSKMLCKNCELVLSQTAPSLTTPDQPRLLVTDLSMTLDNIPFGELNLTTDQTGKGEYRIIQVTWLLTS